MKRICLFLLAMMLLTGCGSKEVYETVTDELAVAASAQPREVRFDLAQEPVLPAMESDSGTLYICGDFDVSVQTYPSGDLKSTVFEVSGFYPEDLTVIQTASGDVDKYEFVWTGATDVGQIIGRATILDDRNYHYVMTATVDAALMEEYQEIWNGIFESFELA